MTIVAAQWLYVTFMKSLCDPSNDLCAFTMTLCGLHNDFYALTMTLCALKSLICHQNDYLPICAFPRIVVLSMILSTLTICCESSQWLCVTWFFVPFTMRVFFLNNSHTLIPTLWALKITILQSDSVSLHSYSICSHNDTVCSQNVWCTLTMTLAFTTILHELTITLCHLHIIFLNHQNDSVTFTANLCDLYNDFVYKLHNDSCAWKWPCILFTMALYDVQNDLL